MVVALGILALMKVEVRQYWQGRLARASFASRLRDGSSSYFYTIICSTLQRRCIFNQNLQGSRSCVVWNMRPWQFVQPVLDWHALLVTLYGVVPSCSQVLLMVLFNLIQSLLIPLDSILSIHWYIIM